ncbi:peptide deformylase [Erythrobacter sp. YT30]|uniref:peptide deformylase n=1 Tax=Erythrobacter sp. YT30 TaxID=1735012 RepID=UPI00076D6545|nr:peptide deformylase [Erythrobacter sp. YT30]KWV90460.1 peptide deformylase [Erythrobacter sp. YT30]
MAIREILEAPDPRLKTVSTNVEPHEFNDELKTLVDDMFETMYDAPGIGLAAIQVGVPKRLLVIDLQEPDMDAEPIVEECDTGCCEPKTRQPVINNPRVFVNPVIVDPADEMSTYQEGCLSVPEIFADIDRPATCTVKYQDLDGSHHEEAMEGLMATCLQHEMDHLEGILFIDHLSRLKRGMALKKLKKLRQAA